MTNRNLNLNKNQNQVVKNDKQQDTKVFLISVIVAIISAMITYSFVTWKYDEIKQITNNSQIYQGELSSNADSEEALNSILMNIKQLRRVIDSEFVGEIDESKLVQQAIKGYVDGLGDEFSEYYTPEEWAEYKESLEGEFYGIGVYMTTNSDKNTVVVSTIKNTPAEEAGLKEDDIIYKVDGEEVLGLDINLVSKKVKGSEGTKVKLTLIRNGKEIEKEIIRKKITVINVSSKVIDKNIGYIKIDSFDSHVSSDFINEYNNLTKQGIEKLILDLRNNTGGDVKETIKILDVFLPTESVLFYTKDSNNKGDVEKALDDNKIDIPIVVLANKYSASASEIVIAALLDNNKAEIIGETSYGKGVIQSVFETSNGAALKLTTLEYFRPNKEKIHKIGIEPTIKVELDADKKDSDGNIIDLQLNRAIKELSK